MRRSFRIGEDHGGLLSLVRRALSMRDLYGEVGMFLADNPEFRQIPGDLLSSVIRRGRPEGRKVSIEGGEVRIGEYRLSLSEPPLRVRGIRRYRILDYEDGYVEIDATYLRAPEPSPHEEMDRTTPGFNEVKERDPTVFFLMVNGVRLGRKFWEKYDALKYFERNPSASREEMRKRGIRTAADWELLTDYQRGVQAWLRANPKPPECNILSKSQMKKREESEYRMPEAIDDKDIDLGRLSRQSFESQIYRSMTERRENFLI